MKVLITGSPTVFPFSIATNLYYFLYYTPF